MLDMRSDNELKKGLMRLSGHMTILLISNRPSLLAIADRSFILKNGILSDSDAGNPCRPATPVQAAQG